MNVRSRIMAMAIPARTCKVSHSEFLVIIIIVNNSVRFVSFADLKLC